MRIYGYTRLNKQRTRPRDLGLKNQATMIHEYANARGLKVKKIFSDTSTTSVSLNLVGMNGLLDLVEKGQIDMLIVARLDRLTRSIRQLSQLIQKICFVHKVRLISVGEGLDSATESGQLALNIIGIISKWDYKMISDRTKELIERKKEIGERVGHAPFGYVYQNKKLVPHLPELKIVILIRDKRNKEQLSYHKIARYLNEHNIPSKRGGKWYAETVKTIYENPLYNTEAVPE